MADTVAGYGRVDSDGADFAEIRPQHVQRTATDDFAIEVRVLGHPEFLNRFIECHEILFQQDLSGIGVDELFDRGHIGGSRAPDHRPAIPWTFGHV